MKDQINNAEKLQKIKSTKAGAYTIAISAILLAVLVVINLLVNLIPASVATFDTSTNKLYTITNDTKKYISKLNEDVVIKWICEGGDEDSTLGTFIDNYAALSPHLSVQKLDPVKNPGVLSQYVTETADQPVNFSFIIESARRYTIVSFDNLFYFYNALLEQSFGMGAVPYDAYVYYQTYFSYAEQSGYETEKFFYGEDTITKAIEFVTLESIPHIYILEGHGETAFSDTFLKMLSTNNVEFESLRLHETGSIPADANCVVIYAPKNDLSDSDAALMSGYLANGGNMLLITSPSQTATSHPNLLGLMSAYGLEAAPGMLYEGSTSNYTGNAYNLKPSINSSHDITYYTSKSGYPAYMPNAHGIIVGENAADATVLFSTSDSAYTMNGDEKSDKGQYALGVAVSKEASGGKTQIVWFSSADAFTDSVAAASSYGNYYYLFYTLFWMNETYETQLATVEGPSLSEPMLSGLTATSIYVWTAVFVILVPTVIIVSGLVVWIKRRRH